MLKEFRQFILRGNVIDLAVGLMIGAAFGTVVNSLVTYILTPLIAAVGGKPDFAALYITIHHSQIKFGLFLNALVTFLILAMVIFFFVIRPINKLMDIVNRSKEPASPSTKKCSECLSEIPIKAKRCAFCTSPQPVKADAIPARGR